MADTNQQIINDLSLRLRKAISSISVKSPTSVRMILDSYLPRLSPSLADAGDGGFPVTVRPHPRFPERSTKQAKYDVLFFYVGNAILAYYAANKVKSDKSIGVFDDRVSRIERMASDGVSTLHVEGTDATGYMLQSNFKSGQAKELGDGLSDQKQPPKVESAGGSGSGISAPPVRES